MLMCVNKCDPVLLNSISIFEWLAEDLLDEVIRRCK